ncbi:hypothetical protein IWX49DRAFT_46555 [Phyllosticta citricarpa]|uniref:Uncharacterized protein n=2 Tax=Phyllosticta TaxID=121621 RepID=A0ABR1MGL1_9PEZI
MSPCVRWGFYFGRAMAMTAELLGATIWRRCFRQPKAKTWLSPLLLPLSPWSGLRNHNSSVTVQTSKLYLERTSAPSSQELPSTPSTRLWQQKAQLPCLRHAQSDDGTMTRQSKSRCFGVLLCKINSRHVCVCVPTLSYLHCQAQVAITACTAFAFTSLLAWVACSNGPVDQHQGRHGWLS